MSRPVVTVSALMRRARECDLIEVPADAIVTPAAADWLRSTRLPIRRSVSSPKAQHPPGNMRCEALHYLIGDGRDPVIQTIERQIERRDPAFSFVSCEGKRPLFLERIARICRLLGESEGRCAAAVIRHGALASLVANKHSGVRAAVCARPSTLWSLVGELGINLIILEKQHLSIHQIISTLERFFDAGRHTDPLVEEALARPRLAGEEAAGEGKR